LDWRRVDRLKGIRKFFNEFLEEWPIAFMDDYRAKEWLSEKTGPKNNPPLITVDEINTQRAPMVFYPSEKLFEEIWGFSDIKLLFRRAITSEKQIHILLVGPPASAKSLFVQNLMKLEDSFFTLGSQSTKAGMIEALFERRPRFLVVDEIGEMSEKDQTVLLSLMEGGKVQKQSTEEVEKLI
jgi:MoxR-like ATPase